MDLDMMNDSIPSCAPPFAFGFMAELVRARATPPARASFDEVYRTMGSFVRRVVRREGVPESVRDDVVQDVFVIAYRRWSQLESSQRLRGWLRGITVRTCWNYRRAQRRCNLRFAPPSDGLEDLPDHQGKDLAQELARDEDLRWLERAVERLDDKQREALVLSRVEGRSASEVSRLTGLSPNTVSSRVRAAMRELRRALDARAA